MRDAVLGLKLDTPRHARLRALLSATLVLNLVDAVMTLFFIYTGAATEANPVMNFVLSGGAVVFTTAKLSLVFSGVAVLWHFRDRVLARAGAVLVTAVYTMLMAYHAFGLTQVAGI